jgi:hypothetical protein
MTKFLEGIIEVEMTDLDKRQKADQQPKKYLWFGYGNYGGGHLTRQLGGGNVRDPSLFEELFKNSKTCFLYAVAGLVGLMVLAMLLAWGLSLVVR